MEITVRSKNKGRSLLDREQLALVRDFVRWSLTRMLPKIVDDIRVELILDGKLFEQSKTYGMAVWEDKHIRGRSFVVEIDTTFPFLTIMHTLAHEIVHVKQWASGEYHPVLNAEDTYVYNKTKIDATKVDYWELPWEIEAHGRSIGLLVLWMRARELAGQDWTKQKIPLH